MNQSHLSRRRFVGLSLAAVSSLAGAERLRGTFAGQATPDGANVPPANLGKDFGGKEVRIGASTEYYAYALRMFQDQVQKEFNVKLKIDVVPATDMYQRNLTEFTSGSSSYDFFMFLPYQLPDYAPHLEQLDTLLAQYQLDPTLDDVLPAFRNIYSTWDGKILSMPFDGDVHLLMYNKDAFENTDLQQKYKATFGDDLGVPDTYDKYLQMAQFFTENPWRKDGQKGYGVAEGLNGPEWWWENRFGAYGGVYFDEEMQPLVNSKNGIAATTNLVQVAKFTPPGANSFGYQETENALVKGDVALSINWSSAFRTSTNPQKSTTVGRIGSAVTPGAMVNGKLNRRDALCTGWSLGIPKYARDKEAAAYLVWFYTRPEVHTAHILDPDTGSRRVPVVLPQQRGVRREVRRGLRADNQGRAGGGIPRPAGAKCHRILPAAGRRAEGGDRRHEVGRGGDERNRHRLGQDHRAYGQGPTEGGLEQGVRDDEGPGGRVHTDAIDRGRTGWGRQGCRPCPLEPMVACRATSTRLAPSPALNRRSAMGEAGSECWKRRACRRHGG